MTYLVWRQHRNQLAFAAAVLATLAVLLGTTGVHAASTYRAASRTCGALGTCSELGSVFHNYGPLLDVVGLTAVAPGLFGLFWGVPLVAREMEQGTQQLVWTQSVTRRRWLAVKVAALLAAAGAWGALVAALVGWWSTPMNSFYGYRFELGHFDTQGIAPIGYAVFAVALGITVGSLLRRVLPALAVTLGGFVAIRFGIDYVLRPHYMKPLTATVPLGSDSPPATGSIWTVSTKMLDPAGRAINGLRVDLNHLPAPCQSLVASGNVGHGNVIRCLGNQGYRTVTAYQPASRFWTFQGMETAIYLALAGCLVVVALWIVGRRDA